VRRPSHACSRLLPPGERRIGGSWRAPRASVRPASKPSRPRLPAGLDQLVGGPRPPRYDLSYRDEFWASREYEDRCDRLALRTLLQACGGHLLDLGAGFGRLVDEYDGFDAVTLVDASPAMIEAARERVDSDPRFSVVAADAAHLPMADSSVDVVVAVRLLVHLGDPSPVFREIARVLRPGGWLIIEFPNRRHLLAWVRYLTGRQSWSPAAEQPHQYLPGHFAHQPATIEARLRSVGLEPDTRRTVSLFRSRRLKHLVPARVLAAIESPLQGPLARIAPGPSIYVRAVRSDAATIGEVGLAGSAR
jgi:SAM-dependent methyltransferase